jgi:signal transduction histidine kinase
VIARLTSSAPVVAGAILGVASVLIGNWLAAPDGTELPYTIIVVLVVAVSGFSLGYRAALATYIVGALTLAIVIVTEPASASLGYSDIVRILAFGVGSLVILYLTRRAESARRVAGQALDASRAAHQLAEQERRTAEGTRAELDRALDQAERERARLEEVAEAIPEPLIVYDGAMRGTYGNRAALRLFGRSFVERSVDEWARLTDPRDEHGAPLARDAWPQIAAQQQPYQQRLVLRIPMSGRDVIVDVEGTPIPGGGAVLLLRDVGKEEDARRRLSRFASFVAHELRNPLAVAKARIELTLRDPGIPTRGAAHAARGLESVDAAIAILERLELYSRADTGTVEAVQEPFALAAALGAAIERFRTGGAEREVLVTLEPGVRIIGDRQLTELAITNLLTNANRYSTPDAPIHGEVEVGDLVTLRVRDEGPGVSDEIARRLFVDRVTAGRGLGLGLFLVHAAMEAMGGSVTLERRRPEAVFALRWPLAEPVEPA